MLFITFMRKRVNDDGEIEKNCFTFITGLDHNFNYVWEQVKRIIGLQMH